MAQPTYTHWFWKILSCTYCADRSEYESHSSLNQLLPNSNFHSVFFQMAFRFVVGNFQTLPLPTHLLAAPSCMPLCFPVYFSGGTECTTTLPPHITGLPGSTKISVDIFCWKLYLQERFWTTSKGTWDVSNEGERSGGGAWGDREMTSIGNAIWFYRWDCNRCLKNGMAKQFWSSDLRHHCELQRKGFAAEKILNKRTRPMFCLELRELPLGQKQQMLINTCLLFCAYFGAAVFISIQHHQLYTVLLHLNPLVPRVQNIKNPPI